MILVALKWIKDKGVFFLFASLTFRGRGPESQSCFRHREGYYPDQKGRAIEISLEFCLFKLRIFGVKLVPQSGTVK